MKAASLLIVLTLLSGCAAFDWLAIQMGNKLPPEPPFPDTTIHRLVVMPVLIQPVRDEQGVHVDFDSELLGRILAEEWTKFAHDEGMQVVFPRESALVMRNEKLRADTRTDLIKIGRILKADAVCLIQLNHYQPYSPKSCSLTFQLYKTEQRDFSGLSLVNITEMGSDIPLDEGGAELALIQRRWDGEDEHVRRRAEAWMNRRNREMDTEWRRVFNVEPTYFRFVFNATLRDYVNALQGLVDANAEPGKHRFTPPAR